MALIAELIGQEIENDDMPISENPYLMFGDPRSTDEADTFIEHLRGEIEEAARVLNEMNRGVRLMHPDGRYFSREEAEAHRTKWIKRKNDVTDRYRWLKQWRKARVMTERGNTFIGKKTGPRALVNHQTMRAALKRFVWLEELYDAVGEFLENDSDASWESMRVAHEAVALSQSDLATREEGIAEEQ